MTGISVLYLHHAGIFGGASRSLFEMIDNLPPGTVRPHLVTQRGVVAGLARQRGIPVIEAAGISQLDNTRYSHYRGSRWLLVLRELAWLGPTLLALWKARQSWRDLDIIHINEATMLPAAWLCRLLFDCPTVLHVRSVQRLEPGSFRSGLVGRMLQKAAAVIAIDETVRASLPPGMPVQVVHNGLTLAEPPAAPPYEGPLRVAMVGNFLALKGVHEFIEAARLCKEQGIAARFLLFGANARPGKGWKDALLGWLGFRQNIESELRQLVAEWGLQSMVEFRGFSIDLQEVYSNMDVLCFPSQLDAPGRPVFEAAFWGVPSIVATRTPTPDTLVPGETGLAIDKPGAQAIAGAVSHFATARDETRRMGENARRLAWRNFDSRKNAAQVLEVYRRLLGPRYPQQAQNHEPTAKARDGA
ncbi:MAG: hypothetical protein JWP36_326 [Paucimonas sp.]|nr:hypothetical protein [Paucimonas sp.]